MPFPSNRLQLCLSTVPRPSPQRVYRYSAVSNSFRYALTSRSRVSYKPVSTLNLFSIRPHARDLERPWFGLRQRHTSVVEHLTPNHFATDPHPHLSGTSHTPHMSKSILAQVKELIPPLDAGLHKGQAGMFHSYMPRYDPIPPNSDESGRVGVLGGSRE